jgi:signal transduction histidine kinase
MASHNIKGAKVVNIENKMHKDAPEYDNESLEELLQERKKQLLHTREELNRLKNLSDIGVLVATVTHELRNPLAAIGMAVHNIRRKAASPAIEKHLRNIDKKLFESKEVIDNLLLYSRRLKSPKFRTTSVDELIQASIQLIQGKHRKDISIFKNIDSVKGVTLNIDPIQITQVFDNILNNACEAVSCKGEIKITAANEKDFIEISIQDNGPGIEEDIIEKMFKPFFTTKARGTGLGLAVCRQIVNMHRGDIGVKKRATRGTCIFVRLPKNNTAGHNR